MQLVKKTFSVSVWILLDFAEIPYNLKVNVFNLFTVPKSDLNLNKGNRYVDY